MSNIMPNFLIFLDVLFPFLVSLVLEFHKPFPLNPVTPSPSFSNGAPVPFPQKNPNPNPDPNPNPPSSSSPSSIMHFPSPAPKNLHLRHAQISF